MKIKLKVLLIGFIIFCIFQMIVMATAIDMGGAAIDRPGTSGTGHTIITKYNPANESGTITSVEIWAHSQLSNVEVATFYIVSGNNFTTRDNETIAGTIAAGEKVVKAVDLTVESGDYIGWYFSAGSIDYTGTGSDGYWYRVSTDSIPCTDTTFSYDATALIFSFEGKGATGAAFALEKFNAVVCTKWNNIAILEWNAKSIP